MALFQKSVSMSSSYRLLIVFLCYIVESVLSNCPEDGDHWSGWWSYDGVSGPERWGAHTQSWSICKTGKNQSPINIVPETLLYDPHLKNLHIEFTKVDGVLKNTKKDITFIVNNSSGNYINFTSGPLSYTYRLSHIKFHFSYRDSPGSEHRIDGKAFSGELHFIAYNAEIYANYTTASTSPRGIAIVAVFLTVGESENIAFNIFRDKFVTIEQKGTCTTIEGLPIEGLIPKTPHYMTYSGSLTQPGCRETVTWVIYNKPLSISEDQMRDLRSIPYQEWRDSNARPVMPLNHRTVRTNINFRKRTRLCTMETDKSYQDYWGTEFHFGAPTSSIHYLYVIAKGSGQVHVEVPGNNLSKYLDVESSRIASICLNCQYYDLLGALSNTYKGDNGIKVSSTVDVSLTLICTDPDISVGIPLVPSSVLSSEYIVPSVASSTKDNYLIIAAKQNSSTVWVKTRNNRTWLHTTLNEFQTQKYGFLYDISGTIITSNYPVSVITYKYGLYNDIQKEIDAALQVIPTHAWGQKYIVPIFNITDPGYFRTFAVSDNTYVHVVENSRSSTVFLNRGQYVDYDSKADHVIVSSTNPIMVINYGANNDSMIHIPALSQYKSSHSFYVVPNVLREHCLFIIVPESHEGGITFRGHQHVPIREMASLVVLKNVRYVIAKFKLLTGGEFNVFHSSHSVPFGAILYSAGDRPYGYTVGMKLPIQGCTQSSVVTTAMKTMTTMTAKMGTTESIYVTNPHLLTNETICFSCQAMSSLVLCNHVQKCGPGKECYVERYITSSGEVRYSSGCSLTSVCNRQTKRSNGCKECCSGSYCNNAGCGDNSTPARSHRGPFCYSCAHVGRVEDCHTIRMCRSNEACSIEKSTWGDTLTHFSLGCQENHCLRTNATSPMVGKRSLTDCRQCCQDDFCNTHCSQSSAPLIVNWHGPPAPGKHRATQPALGVRIIEPPKKRH